MFTTKLKVLLRNQLMDYDVAMHSGTVSHFTPRGLGKLSRLFFSMAGMLTRWDKSVHQSAQTKPSKQISRTLWKRSKKEKLLQKQF